MYGMGLFSERGGLSDGGLDQILWLAYERVFSYDVNAVQVFIVLSGFSLMLPIGRAHSRSVKGGWGTFFMRRTVRIIPTFYAALTLSLLIIALVPGMNRPVGVYWDLALPALETDVVLSHLALVHNFNSAWLMRINPPMLF